MVYRSGRDPIVTGVVGEGIGRCFHRGANRSRMRLP
jgi:hypothetical protein